MQNGHSRYPMLFIVSPCKVLILSNRAPNPPNHKTQSSDEVLAGSDSVDTDHGGRLGVFRSRSGSGFREFRVIGAAV